MKITTRVHPLTIAAVAAAAILASPPLRAGEPVKVFILAGQSNMEGAGRVEGDPNHNEGKGSLSYLAEHDPKYAHLKTKSGSWVARDDVSIWYLGRKGPLAPGFGSNGGTIGPELGFGQVMGDAFDEPVLLIKLAWGGKSLAKDFRPPSSGGEVGPFYTEMLSHVKEVLDNLKKNFSSYKDGFEIAGFGWHQGWNDGCEAAATNEYEVNLGNFIRDVRKELGVEKLPFVIADSGFGGKSQNNGRRLAIRAAQAAPAKSKEFKGSVLCVETENFFRPAEESPSNQGYHWNGNAETYYLIGAGMGEAMKELLAVAAPTPKAPAPMHLFRSADGSKSFKARLEAYDPATKEVTVRRENGQLLKFDLQKLHPDDQEFASSDSGNGE